eukprot:CAMPEP_0178734030 /NCGR_PEP_ID=MMETSP0744-20121128/1122_1 /TAXON_ID=913974 /ORGANISM="Nitzschia punctata, Strain CCMP561" /LENGTH=77 /DNA_ID=CAMNT_0020386275 /DNA_START=139 /DNA_END=373 /DNA_ORIENTATION=+
MILQDDGDNSTASRISTFHPPPSMSATKVNAFLTFNATVGLPFKLAMILMGMLPGYDMDRSSGGECSGIIEADGDKN